MGNSICLGSHRIHLQTSSPKTAKLALGAREDGTRLAVPLPQSHGHGCGDAFSEANGCRPDRESRLASEVRRPPRLGANGRGSEFVVGALAPHLKPVPPTCRR